MKIVRLEGNSVLLIAEEPDPVPGPGEVLIETVHSAICGSEMGAYRGGGSKSGNGGHEAVGKVAGLGEGVTGLQVGERVGASAVAGCGTCSHCAAGRQTWCAKWKFYGRMHAQRFVASANGCLRLPPEMPWDVGTLVSGDGMGVPYHSSQCIAGPQFKTILVVGLGPIGLGQVLLHTHLGRQVIGVDPSAPRREYAKKLGAGETLDPTQEDVPARVRAATDGNGPDAAIEAAGRPETARVCFELVRPGGTVLLNGEQKAVELSPSKDFIRRDITAVGAWYYQLREFPEMVRLWREGLRVADLISHRIPYTEAETAFQLFSAGKTAKVLLTYGA